jgi:CheY-like chemotaxis protein
MKTVLLLDDNDIIRRTLGTILRCKGKYCVLEAADEAEAVGLCEHQSSEIELVITDVNVGSRCGRDIAEHLKNLCPTTHVLFISGYPREHLVGNGILQSGDACLDKPFTPDKLLQRVGEILQSSAKAPLSSPVH